MYVNRSRPSSICLGNVSMSTPSGTFLPFGGTTWYMWYMVSLHTLPLATSRHHSIAPGILDGNSTFWQHVFFTNKNVFQFLSCNIFYFFSDSWSSRRLFVLSLSSSVQLQGFFSVYKGIIRKILFTKWVSGVWQFVLSAVRKNSTRWFQKGKT